MIRLFSYTLQVGLDPSLRYGLFGADEVRTRPTQKSQVHGLQYLFFTVQVNLKDWVFKGLVLFTNKRDDSKPH